MSDIREAFERTVKANWSDSYSFMRDTDGHYSDDVLDAMWWAWQASGSESPNNSDHIADDSKMVGRRVEQEPVATVKFDMHEFGANHYAELHEFLEPGTKLYTAPQPAEQQPAPDVAALVTLLDHAQCPNCDGSGARYDSHGEPEQCQWCCERDAALSAHRKGGYAI